MSSTLEERVARLEREMKRMKAGSRTGDTRPWWERRFGAFKDDPLYEEAVREGAAYRKAQLPEYMKEDTSGDVPA